MTATVAVRCHHTNGDDGGTDVAGATLRFHLADNDVADALTQVTRPGGAGFAYSWVKQFRLFTSVTPLGSIANIKFYMPGPKPVGADVNIKTTPTYLAPVTNAATPLAGGTIASGYNYTSANPLSVAGSLANPSTGQTGDFVQAQMAVQQTALAGVNDFGKFVFRYDES